MRAWFMAGIAMLAAIGLARLLRGTRRDQIAGWGLAAFLAVECPPASPPLYTPTIIPEYRLLKTSRRPGAVCELPMGLRDGRNLCPLHIDQAQWCPCRDADRRLLVRPRVCPNRG
jgi:hypothetical protein